MPERVLTMHGGPFHNQRYAIDKDATRPWESAVFATAKFKAGKYVEHEGTAFDPARLVWVEVS